MRTQCLKLFVRRNALAAVCASVCLPEESPSRQTQNFWKKVAAQTRANFSVQNVSTSPHRSHIRNITKERKSYLPGRSNKKHSSSSEHRGETFWQNAGWHSHTIMLNPTTSRTYLCSDMKCDTPAPCSHMHPGTHMSSEICSRTIFYIHPDMFPGKCSEISFDIDPGSIFTYF